VTRAVVFDLWDTLVDFDVEGSLAVQTEMAKRLGRDPEEFRQAWNETRARRETGPLATALAGFGADEALVRELVELRTAATRRWLVPRDGALETLRELGARGLARGLITVCSEEVALLWDESPFRGLFEATVFSCQVGLAKPDPRIYRLACEQLGVEPAEALFVGDGANDELAGAERVGMRAVLIHRPGKAPYWPGALDWPGARVTSIPEVLELL
jgi:putative hydrolase of the HAD superfamily